MLTGPELGAAIEAARIAKGVSKKKLADDFSVKPPSVQGWVKNGRIDKSKLMDVIAYFADVVEPTHWGLRPGFSFENLPDDPAGDANEHSDGSGASAADMVKQMLSKQGRTLSESARNRLLAAAEEADSPGEGNQTYLPSAYASLKPRREEIVIPQYDVRGAMGHGQVPADYNEAVRNLVVREEMLREKGVSYTSASALAMITGWGQSMEGTINDKDLLIVDRGVNDFIGEGIYVITWHQELYVKRIMRKDEDHYRLISDNQHYENQTARIDDVTIHAKVLFIWNGRKA